jgi:hypothetical protein
MKHLLAALLLVPVVASAQVSAPIANWSVQHQPAAATAATISRAAVATRRHVATGLTVCVSGVAAQPTLVFNLRDGATGAGTILWSARLMAPLGSGQCVVLSGLSIPGSVNTAMTLESAAAPAATNFATVSLQGYDKF